MPTLLIWKGWIFGFYSGDLGEPPHIHVRKGRKEAKIWLLELAVARNRGCNSKEIKDILSKTTENRDEFLEKWNGYFGN